MRLCTTVIFTDQLDQVRSFYQEKFPHLPTVTSHDKMFSVMPFAEAQITWIDAANAGQPITQNTMLRISTQFANLERAAMVARGVICGDLTVEDWGPFYGAAVRYFSVTDPSGTRILYYESHYGEAQQLITVGDGTGTRQVHNPSK